jgi:uncharacterized coiled-coil protein SlyX
MSRSASVVLTVLVLLLFGATGLLWQKYRTASHDYQAMRSTQDATQAKYGEALNAIGEIQDSLATLGLGEATRPLLPGTPPAEGGLSLVKGREALDRIALIKAGLERTHARLVELERRVHLGGVKIAGLEHVIVNLKSSIAEREARISELTGRIDTLQTQVGELSTEVVASHGTISQQQELIENQRREKDTVYYVVGSRGTLSKQGVIVTTGGFLGLGRTIEPSRALPESLFTPFDTNGESIISIPARRARVVSAQPASSYQVLPAGEELELHILDAKAFRSVRHVVIVTG